MFFRTRKEPSAPLTSGHPGYPCTWMVTDLCQASAPACLSSKTLWSAFEMLPEREPVLLLFASCPSSTSRPSIWCLMSGFGPLNHLRALRNHQMIIASIGPPYTRHVQFMCAALFSCQLLPLQEAGNTYSRFDPVRLGNIRMGTINMTKVQAAMPIGKLALPKCQGPLLNRLPTKNTRIEMGIVKATNAATAAIEKRAPAASGPPNIKRLRQIPMVVLNQTALTGV